MADAKLEFDIVGNADSAVRAFGETALAADEAARATGRYSGKQREAGLAADAAAQGFRRLLGSGSGAGGGGAAGGAGGLAALGPYGIGAGVAAGALAAPAALGTMLTLGIGAIGVKEALATNAKAAGQFSDALKAIDAAAGKAFQPVVGAMAEMAKQLAGPVGKLFADAEPGFLSFIKNLEPAIAKVIPELGQFIRAFGPEMAQMGHTAGMALEAIVRALQNLEPAFHASANFIHGFVGVVSGLLDGLARFVGDFVRIIGDLFTGRWGDLWKRAKDFVSYATTGMEKLLNDLLVWVGQWGARMLGQFTSWLGQLPDKLFRIGANIVQGLIGGIESMFGNLAGTVGHLASSIVGSFGHLLGIGSPSTVFAQHGRDIVAGLVQGIDGSASLAAAAVGRLGAGLGSPVSGALAAQSGAGYGAAGQQITLRIEGSGNAADEFLAEMISRYAQAKGGGSLNSVQIAFGMHHA